MRFRIVHLLQASVVVAALAWFVRAAPGALLAVLAVLAAWAWGQLWQNRQNR